MNITEAAAGLSQAFRRGTLIMLVLSQLHAPTYGYSLIKKRNDHSIPTEPNTLYPLLRQLESQGILKSEWDTTESKPRKYYQITEDGILVLKEVKKNRTAYTDSVKALPEEKRKTDLKERYLYAATRWLEPRPQEAVALAIAHLFLCLASPPLSCCSTSASSSRITAPPRFSSGISISFSCAAFFWP